MTKKFFIDTNILIYSIDNNYPKKKKLNSDPGAVKNLLKSFENFEVIPINTSLIYNAIDCSIQNTISFWDALIVSAASSAGCSKIFSEDLNNEQILKGVEIINPFTVL